MSLMSIAKRRIYWFGLVLVLVIGVALIPVPAYNCKVMGLPLLSSSDGRMDIRFRDERMYIVGFPETGEDFEIGKLNGNHESGIFWDGRYGEKYLIRFYLWGVVMNEIGGRKAIGFRRF